MKATLIKLVTIAALSGVMAACSSTPKEPPAPIEPIVSLTPLEITETPRGPMVSLDDVLFDFDKSTLRPEAQPILQQAAALLNENADQVALIEGHTDHTGDAQFNQFLSIERSRSVKDALVSYGVDATRIKTDGLGETQPVSSNDTREGRQANRRVEIIFQSEENAGISM